MTDFRMTVRADCAISACTILSLSIKVLTPSLLMGRGGGGVGSQLLDRHVPPPQPPTTASIQNKANFSFHQPGFLLVFEQQATGSGFGTNILECSVKAVSKLEHSPHTTEVINLLVSLYNLYRLMMRREKNQDQQIRKEKETTGRSLTVCAEESYSVKTVSLVRAQ